MFSSLASISSVLRNATLWIRVGVVVGSFFTPTANIAVAQQVAGTVEDGLGQLAAAIAERSKAAERSTIAVLPFRHADGNCSVLSTYIVDELILSLFSLPNAQLDIIERSQLEAIIAELSIGEGGLLNPATTKELGNLSGVSALTIGTITVIGDSVRLNARLVATDTGRIFSAAAVTVPKTQALNSLLSQASSCGISETRRTASKPSTSIEISPANNKRQNELVLQGLRFMVEGVFQNKDKKETTLRLSTTNTGKEKVAVIWVRPVPTIIDDRGNVQYLADMAGQQQCRNSSRGWFDMNPGNCINSSNKSRYTLLAPGVPSIVSLRFRRWKDSGKGDEALAGDTASLAATVQVVKKEGIENLSVSVPQILLPQ